jgi:pyruvate formate lyase activating enzyme
MTEPEGLVFDIQAFSVHDGPGCRTTVFMMGCPMRCDWCANPEGWQARQRLLYRATKCTREASGCIRCISRCPKQAISTGETKTGAPVIDWSKCETCEKFECTQACLKEALVVCGRRYTVAELMKMFQRDRHYWGSNGGVSFSGGEPLFQKEFLTAVLNNCRESCIHTAIETSAFFPQDQFLAIMQKVDFAFVDIKHMDTNKHSKQAGVANEIVLSNVAALAASSWNGRLVIRVPVIPGFNEDDENIIATAEFLKQVGLAEINLLPFHRMGDSKWRQCGMEYPYRAQEAPSPELMRHIQNLVSGRGIACYTGADTPF